jgi:hypothetical protein
LSPYLPDTRQSTRRLNVHLRKTLVAIALVAAATLALIPAAPAVAQEVVQDEGEAYRAWYEANQAKDFPKAVEAAKAFLAQYPTGQYAASIKKWLPPYEFDAAVKEKRTSDMVKAGRELLAADPENLTIFYVLAFNIRRNEIFARPQNLQNLDAAVEFAGKAIPQIEAGKTPPGFQTFDKNATLGWMTQILAVSEQKNGSPEKAIELLEKSASLAPQDATVVVPALLGTIMLRQTKYTAAAKALQALPPADLAAPEPKPEVKAARDAFDGEADLFIDVAARYLAYAKVRNLPASPTRDKVSQTLETVYKNRFPQDTALAGLQKVLQEKETAFGTTPGA